MSSPHHPRLRALIRSELRTLLIELLQSLPPAAPPRPVEPPPAPVALVAVLDAWAALDVAGQGLSVRDALARIDAAGADALLRALDALRGDGMAVRVRERLDAGDTWGAGHPLGQMLRTVRGRVSGGRVLEARLDRARGVMVWRVASLSPAGPELPIAG